MKVAMAMTLDGLLRSLRWKAHDLAENVEHGYRAPTRTKPSVVQTNGRRIRTTEEPSNDRSGR